MVCKLPLEPSIIHYFMMDAGCHGMDQNLTASKRTSCAQHTGGHHIRFPATPSSRRLRPWCVVADLLQEVLAAACKPPAMSGSRGNTKTQAGSFVGSNSAQKLPGKAMPHNMQSARPSAALRYNCHSHCLKACRQFDPGDFPQDRVGIKSR